MKDSLARYLRTSVHSSVDNERNGFCARAVKERSLHVMQMILRALQYVLIHVKGRMHAFTRRCVTADLLFVAQRVAYNSGGFVFRVFSPSGVYVSHLVSPDNLLRSHLRLSLPSSLFMLGCVSRPVHQKHQIFHKSSTVSVN